MGNLRLLASWHIRCWCCQYHTSHIHWHRSIHQKIIFLLYGGAGCILCKAGFTQQALTGVWVAFEWCVASLETLVMRCRGVPFTGTNIVMFLRMYSTEVQYIVWQLCNITPNFVGRSMWSDPFSCQVMQHIVGEMAHVRFASLHGLLSVEPST